VEPDGIRTLEASQEGTPLAVIPLRMPREVTKNRVFTHTDYLLERAGQPIPLRADEAWEVDSEVGSKTVVFM